MEPIEEEKHKGELTAASSWECSRSWLKPRLQTGPTAPQEEELSAQEEKKIIKIRHCINGSELTFPWSGSQSKILSESKSNSEDDEQAFEFGWWGFGASLLLNGTATDANMRQEMHPSECFKWSRGVWWQNKHKGELLKQVRSVWFLSVRRYLCVEVESNCCGQSCAGCCNVGYSNLPEKHTHTQTHT